MADYGTNATARFGKQILWLGLRLVLATTLTMGSPSPADAQARAVAGRVVTQAGVPLGGAQILLEGTERGVLTNAQGLFRLEGIQGSQVTLQVVMIGYQTATQTVAAGSVDVVIVLRERAVELDELVVTGTTGAVQKRALGNTVATLDAAATMRVAPAVSLSELLTAKTPGLSIRPAGGAGVGARLKIRGTASLTLDTQPLIYIDGVRADNAVATGPGIQGGGVSSRLNDINPEDIESIEIIKGPAAATLYGTEASSGVIQIITKKGRPGDMTVGVGIRQGINWFPNPEGVFPTNWYKGPETGGELRSLNVIQREADEGRNVFRNGYSQGYSLSLQGGTAQAGYYFSGDFDRTEGYDPSNLSSRYAGRTNLSLSPHPTIDLNANLGLTAIRTRLGREESPTNSIYGAGVRGNPRYLDTPSRGFYTMPPEVINSIYFVNQDVDRFITSVQATHRPFSWLTERLVFGVDFVKESNSVLVPNLTPDLARFISATAANDSGSLGCPFTASSRASNRAPLAVVIATFAGLQRPGASRSMSGSTSTAILAARSRIAGSLIAASENASMKTRPRSSAVATTNGALNCAAATEAGRCFSATGTPTRFNPWRLMPIATLRISSARSLWRLTRSRTASIEGCACMQQAWRARRHAPLFPVPGEWSSRPRRGIASYRRPCCRRRRARQGTGTRPARAVSRRPPPCRRSRTDRSSSFR